jgi:hypothetical protein
LDEIGKLRAKNIRIAIVLVEKYSTGISNLISSPLYKNFLHWDKVEEYNKFLKSLEAPDLITIDLNPVVCADD